MDIKDFEYVEFKQTKKGYSYVYAGRTGFLLRKCLKFTVKSKTADMNWAKVQYSMKQLNYFIHDLSADDELNLGECTLTMDDFNKSDIEHYGKDPEYWKELARGARSLQKLHYAELRTRMQRRDLN